MGRRDGRADRARLAAATYPCAGAGCGATADYLVTHRHLEPKRKIRVKGIDKIVEPYATSHLCEDCTRTAVASGDPPRSTEALPHKVTDLKAQAKAERAAVKHTPTGGQLLGEWGR